jgi:hypothetical protein
MEMLLMFSCSKDNATKCPITGSCEERERERDPNQKHYAQYIKFSADNNNNELVLLQFKISTIFIFSYLNSHYMTAVFL